MEDVQEVFRYVYDPCHAHGRPALGEAVLQKGVWQVLVAVPGAHDERHTADRVKLSEGVGPTTDIEVKRSGLVLERVSSSEKLQLETPQRVGTFSNRRGDVGASSTCFGQTDRTRSARGWMSRG